MFSNSNSNFYYEMEIEDTFNKQPYELIHRCLPTINKQLVELSIYVYTVFISYKYINIRVREPPINKHRFITDVSKITKTNKVSKTNKISKVSKVYFINNKLDDVLIGEGFKVFYNPTLYILKYFSFEWNKKIGLFIKRSNGQEDCFLSNNKDLSQVLNKNYRRIWNV